MAFTLDFAQLIGYDPSQAGIQVNVGLTLIEGRTEVLPKLILGRRIASSQEAVASKSVLTSKPACWLR